MKYHPLHQLTLVKLRDLVREPEALFWVFVFPILLALALGIAFRSSGPPSIPIGVQAGQGSAWVVGALESASGLVPEILDEQTAARRLRTGKVALVVVPGERWTYWSDPSRPESRLAELAVDDALQRAAGRADVRASDRREMNEKGSRYVDFLIPGLLGMNLMGTGMWGVGFYVVSARARGILKRLVATPMRRSHYLASQFSGRLIFLIFEVGVLLAFARLVFDVPQRGNWLTLSFVAIVGAASFSGLGLLVAARPRTIEGVSGLMNFVMMPMWLGSGIFFSTARFPDLVQPLVQALPLTAVNDALRGVMLEGAGLGDVAGELLIAGGWGVASFVVALRTFRWS